MTGAAVQWLRDGLQIVGNAAETEAVAATVDDTDGVVFVPALTGLGAPHWDPHARGTILGITRGTTRAHIVRATLEAIAFEVRDVLETMPRAHHAAGRRRRGGQRPALPVPGRPGRACPSSGRRSSRRRRWARRSWPGSATGVWSSTDDLRETWALDRRFIPAGDRDALDASYARWTKAVERVEGLGRLRLVSAGRSRAPSPRPPPPAPRRRSPPPRPARPRPHRARRRCPRGRTRAAAILLRSSSISDCSCNVFACSFSTARRAARSSFCALAELGLGLGDPLVRGRARLLVRLRIRYDVELGPLGRVRASHRAGGRLEAERVGQRDGSGQVEVAEAGRLERADEQAAAHRAWRPRRPASPR